MKGAMRLRLFHRASSWKLRIYNVLKMDRERASLSSTLGTKQMRLSSLVTPGIDGPIVCAASVCSEIATLHKRRERVSATPSRTIYFFRSRQLIASRERGAMYPRAKWQHCHPAWQRQSIGDSNNSCSLLALNSAKLSKGACQ